MRGPLNVVGALKTKLLRSTESPSRQASQKNSSQVWTVAIFVSETKGESLRKQSKKLKYAVKGVKGEILLLRCNGVSRQKCHLKAKYNGYYKSVRLTE